MSSLVAPKNQGQQDGSFKKQCCLVVHGGGNFKWGNKALSRLQSWWDSNLLPADLCEGLAMVALRPASLHPDKKGVAFLKSTKWGTWGGFRFIDMKKLRSYIKEWASAEDFPCFISIRPKGQQPKQEECAQDGLLHSNLKPVQGANKNPLQSNHLRNHDASRLEKMDTPDPQVWGINIYPDQWEDTLHPEVSEVDLEILEFFCFTPRWDQKERG